MNSPSSIPRRHRKRFSAIRLSSDTTSTLPEYTSNSNWPRFDSYHHHQLGDTIPSDKPPEYPDSAEEADEDTDSDSNNEHNTAVYVPHPPTPLLSSPRRSRRSQTHRRKLSSPKSLNRRPSGSRSDSADPYLDSLLERSVHALEMSNALLQSSISTQTSISTLLTPDSPADRTLEARALGLSSRICSSRNRYENWADDLDEISKDVEGLFTSGSRQGYDSNGDEVDAKRHGMNAKRERNHTNSVDSISCSLPSASSTSQVANGHHRRRPSLDLRQGSSNDHESKAQLRLSPKERCHLVAPPPRALTQYIESNEDPSIIMLPSTIGLRGASSSHSTTDSAHIQPPHSPSSSTKLNHVSSKAPLNLPDPHSIYFHAQVKSKSASTLSLPIVTDKPLEPSTAAYAMLSSFIYRPPPSAASVPASGTTTPSSSFVVPSFLSSAVSRRHSKSLTPNGKAESKSRSRSPSLILQKSPDLSPGQIDSPTSIISIQRSRSTTPKPLYHPHTSPSVLRCMTPPLEEQSSSSSDGFVGKMTVASLRKILDEQPPAVTPDADAKNVSPSPSRSGGFKRPPAFLPRSPPPVAEAGTSTATASISRLFTKATHSSSTRPPSPPKYSSLKHSPNSASASGTNSPAMPSSPGLLMVPNTWLGTGSGNASESSGRSTPKRISFIEPSEPRASQSGGNGKFRERVKRRGAAKGKGKAHAKRRSASGDEGDEGEAGGTVGWLAGWFGGVVGSGSKSQSRFLQEEERFSGLSRNWGPRVGIGGGLDEWAV